MSSRPSPEFPDVSAAILAGGMATRMGGTDKAFLELGGQAILDRQLAVLRPRFAEVIVSLGAEVPGPAAAAAFSARGLVVVQDEFESSGPLAGLHSALESCRTPWLFAVACDMPFLDGGLIDRIAMGTAWAAGFLAQAGKLFLVHVNDNYRNWDWDMIPGSVNTWDLVELMFFLGELGYNGWMTSDVAPFRLDPAKTCSAETATADCPTWRYITLAARSSMRKH